MISPLDIQFEEFVGTLCASLGLSSKEALAPMPPLEPTYARVYMRCALQELRHFQSETYLMGFWMFWDWVFTHHLDQAKITSTKEKKSNG